MRHAIQRQLHRPDPLLHQLDPQSGRRHAHDRVPLGPDPRDQPIRQSQRTGQGQGPGYHRRRRARGSYLCAQSQAPRPEVREPDQGQIGQPGSRRHCQFHHLRGADGFLRNESSDREKSFRESHDRRACPRGGAQGPRDGAQERADRRRATGQIGRLLRARSLVDRIVHRRGRLGRRFGQAGTRPSLPGHPSDPRQADQRGESAFGQGAAEYRNPNHDHRGRHGHRRGRAGRILQFREAALRTHHHHDRRRRGRLAHPHAAAHVLLPPDDRTGPPRLRLHRPAAALPDQAQEARRIRR